MRPAGPGGFAASMRFEPVQFSVLGPLRVTVGGRDVRLGPLKQQLALLMLLLRANQVVPFAAHCEAVWGDPPPSAESNLRTYLAALRRSMGDRPPRRLAWRGCGYQLTVRPGELDLHLFEEHAARGETALARGDLAGAVDALRQALDTWRQPEVAVDRCGPRLRLLYEALLDRHAAVVSHYLDAELMRGNDVTLVPTLRRIIADDPTNERHWCRLMIALARAGDTCHGLAAYRDAYQVLDTQLGVGPGKELRWVHQALLTKDARLTGPAGMPWLCRAPAAA